MSPIGIPDRLRIENGGENIFTFFENLKSKMRVAVANTFERLKIAEPVAPSVAPAPVQNDLWRSFIPSLPLPGSTVVREQQCADWLDAPAVFLDPAEPDVLKPTVLQFWEQHGKRYPAMQELARAVLPAQASSAESERVWSAADDQCGGDRSSLNPETLNSTLVLRINTPVRAQCEGVPLFQALSKKK